MKKKGIYKTKSIKDVDVAALLTLLTMKVIVAIDVAKEAMVAGLADALGRVVALVRFSHPTETRLFVELVTALRDSSREVVAAMEPTGVYGESVRYQLELRHIEVFRVDPKRAHDASLVLDGVPSQHDPKACTLIAFLHAQGISTRWRVRTAFEAHARVLVDEHALIMRPLQLLQGRLEAATAMHWPELNALIDQRTNWYLHLLSAFPSPKDVVATPAEVRSLLRRKTFGKLEQATVDKIVRSASDTVGVPPNEHQSALLKLTASEILATRARIDDVDSRLRTLVATHEGCSRLAQVIGPAAAVAIFADLGDPASFHSAAALEKACGLNLIERSSGTHRGRHHISKRGPARVRQYLYLAAIRLIAANALARRWYERRSSCSAGTKHKAVIAVVRKLVRAAHHVAKGSAFDATKLFDTRRLFPRHEVASPQTSRAAMT